MEATVDGSVRDGGGEGMPAFCPLTSKRVVDSLHDVVRRDGSSKWGSTYAEQYGLEVTQSA